MPQTITTTSHLETIPIGGKPSVWEDKKIEPRKVTTVEDFHELQRSLDSDPSELVPAKVMLGFKREDFARLPLSDKPQSGEGENSPEPAKSAVTTEQMLDMVEINCERFCNTEEPFPVELAESEEEIKLEQEKLKAALTQNAIFKGLMRDAEAKREAEGCLRLIRGLKNDITRLLANKQITSTPEYAQNYQLDADNKTKQAGEIALELFDLFQTYNLSVATEDDVEEQEIGRSYMAKITSLEPNTMWSECPSEVYKIALDREHDNSILLKEAEEKARTLENTLSSERAKIETARKTALNLYTTGTISPDTFLQLLNVIGVPIVTEEELPAFKQRGLTPPETLELIALTTWTKEIGTKK